MVTSVFTTQSCGIKPFEGQGPIEGVLKLHSLFAENTFVPTDRAATAGSKPLPPPGWNKSSFTN